MTFSVRDLSILTAYSALILSKVELLTVLVMAASFAGLFFISFVFGITTLRAVFNPRRDSRTLRASFPVVLIALTWGMALVIAGELFQTHRNKIESVAISMLTSLAAATIPLLFNMHIKQLELNDSTIWIGYWTLWVAMASGGVAAIVLHSLYEGLGWSMAADVFRFSTVCGLILSVVASWWLISTQPPKPDRTCKQ